MPCSPILVSSPHGRSLTKSAWAAASAAWTSSSEAPGTPRVTFSRPLTENSVGASNAHATAVASARRGARGSGIEDRVDALGRGRGLLAEREYVAHRLDRPDQLEYQSHEGD